MTQRKIDVFDFFSGCGGTSLGLKQAGMNVRIAIDMDKPSLDTLALNLPSTIVINEDIRILKPEDLKCYIGKSPMLFVACAPCQPFSKIRQRSGNEDERSDLLLEFIKFIEFFKPEYLLIENVPGMQKADKNDLLGKFLAKITELGYYYDLDILDASDFGIPQKRKRLIILASRFGQLSLPVGDTPTKKTVRDTISHLPPIIAGEVSELDPLHRSSSLSEINLKRISSTPVGGSRLDWDEEFKLECHKNFKGHSDVYGRMEWDKPASTLTTKCNSLSNGRFGHPEQNRAISLREAALLQTFPENFQAVGNIKSLAKQIGNAVPPLFAEKLGKIIIDDLAKYI